MRSKEEEDEIFERGEDDRPLVLDKPVTLSGALCGVREVFEDGK